MTDMPLFSETRGYHRLRYALAPVTLGAVFVFIPVLMVLLSGRPVPTMWWTWTWLAAALAVAAYVFTCRQRVTVYPGRVAIALGLVELWRKTVDLRQVRTIEAITFSPLTDFRGWGVKRGRDGYWCYNTKGNQGVRLTGERIKLVIGSDDPVGLAAAIEKARGTDAS